MFDIDCKFNNYLSSYDTAQNKIWISKIICLLFLACRRFCPYSSGKAPVGWTLSVQQWSLPARGLEHNYLCHNHPFSYAYIKQNLITPASMQLWKMINSPGFMAVWQRTWKSASKSFVCAPGQAGLCACLPGAAQGAPWTQSQTPNETIMPSQGLLPLISFIERWGCILCCNRVKRSLLLSLLSCMTAPSVYKYITGMTVLWWCTNIIHHQSAISDDLMMY